MPAPEGNQNAVLAYRLALLGRSDIEIAWILDLDCHSIESYKTDIANGRQDRPGYLAAKEEKRRGRRVLQNKIQNTKRKNDPRYRLSCNVRSALRQRLKSKGNKKTFDILPFTIDELKAHLESQFRDGMTWENYGPYWHVDHKRPDCSFQYENPSDPDFMECWALSNLQPLLKFENLSKGGKYGGS